MTRETVIPSLRVESPKERSLVEVAPVAIIMILTADCVVIKVESVSNTESVSTHVTSEAVQVIHVFTRPHYHLKRWNDFQASRANSCGSKQSDVVSFTKYLISFDVKLKAQVRQLSIAIGTLQTLFVPELV